MKIKRFEQLDAWLVSRELTRDIYGISRSAFPMEYRLRDQITGALLSIMNYIAEGFDSQSNREFIRFLTYSRRSCSEVQNCLYVAADQKFIDQIAFEEMYEKTRRTRQLIDGLLRYLRTVRAPAVNGPNGPAG